MVNERLKNGDPKAFEILYNKYFDLVYSLAIKALKNRDVASDIVQDTFIKIWNNRDNISVELSLEHQLIVLSKNVIHDFLRKRIREEKLLGDLSQIEISELFETKQGHSHQLNKLHKAIKSLPVRQKEIIEMAKFEGLTYEEIGRTLNISKHTVSSHFSEGMKNLKKLLSSWIFI